MNFFSGPFPTLVSQIPRSGLVEEQYLNTNVAEPSGYRVCHS